MSGLGTAGPGAWRTSMGSMTNMPNLAPMGPLPPERVLTDGERKEANRRERARVNASTAKAKKAKVLAARRAQGEADVGGPSPREAEHPARDAVGLESDPLRAHSTRSAILNPYIDDDIGVEQSRTDIQKLVTGMKSAQRTLSGAARHAAEQRCIAEFVGTPYGRLARNKLMRDGKVCVPLFASEQEARTKTSSMASAVARLVEDTDGSVKSVMLKRRYTRIKGQDRLMIPLSDLGTDFGSVSGDMEETLVYVLWALDNPGYDRILAEISTCLLSLEGLLAQVLHRDQVLEKITDQMAGRTQAATRGNSRPQPPPYSALCAFQEGTILRIVDGSHLDVHKNYEQGSAVECQIPRGWGLLWHGLSVHGGDGCTAAWLARLHIFLRALGCPQAATGKIDLVD